MYNQSLLFYKSIKRELLSIGGGAYEPGTEARASSEFRARRHAMKRASTEFLPSNAARPQIVVLNAFCWIKNTKNRFRPQL